MDSGRSDHWVFGFGSLMWDPGFRALASRPGRIHGYHRRFSVLSYESWGSHARPGLAAALHAGGSCQGRALRVAGEDWAAVSAYLRKREQAYRHVWLACHTPEGPVRALTFVTDSSHPRTAPALDFSTTVRHLAEGVGRKGSSRDYLFNTIASLREQGSAPGLYLRRLAAALGEEVTSGDETARG